LFSILLSNEQPDLTPDAVTGKAVTITNFDIMDGVEVPRTGQSDGSDSPASLDVGGGGVGGPPTEEVAVPIETRGEPPRTAEDKRKQELWSQIKEASRNYANQDPDFQDTVATPFGENITQLISEWQAEFDAPVEVKGPAGNVYDPVNEFYDEYGGGKTMMSQYGGMAREMFDVDLLRPMAVLFAGSEVNE